MITDINTAGNRADYDMEQVTEAMRGKGVPFYRIRRITGYLSGDLKRFNNAKKAEVADRVEHPIETDCLLECLVE